MNRPHHSYGQEQNHGRGTINKNVFFCNKEGSQGDKLFTVLYDKSGNRRGSDLKRAMEIKNDEKFRVKLSEAIDPNDTLAIDVMYHHGCWRDNVDHVLRSEKLSETRRGRDLTTEFAAKIEFIGLIRGLLDGGHKISMAEVQKGYERIR